MKKYLFIVAAFAVSMVSCKKSEIIGGESAEKVIMTVDASAVDTKTFISTSDEGVTYSPSWSAGDAIKVLEFSKGTFSQAVESSSLEAASTDASFTVSLTSKSTGSYKYYAVYPASSYGTGGSGSSEFYRLNLPETQTFSSTSFGQGADLLVSGPVSETLDEQPSTVNLKFKRIGSTARMTVNGMTAGETITSVSFSTTEDYIAGFSKYDPQSGIWGGTYTASKKEITLTPSSTYTTTGSDVIWFRLYPVELTEDFTVKVTTNKAIYSKTVNLAEKSRSIKFEDEGLTKFAVSDLERTAKSTDGYKLLTSVSDLMIGDKILLVYYKESDGKYYVNGSAGKDYLTSVDAEVGEGLLTTTTGCPLTVGKTGNYYTFSNGEYKLCTTDVKKLYYGEPTTGTVVDTWNVTIDASTNVASIKSTTSSNGTIYYNATSPRFTTYTTAQAGIYIYKYEDGKESPELSATAGSVSVGKGLDVASLLTSKSDGAYTYTVSSAPDAAVYSLSGSSFNATTPGSYTVTVNQAATDVYKAASVNVSVTANDREWVLSSIAVTTAPTKISYEAGESFDPAGMVVTATYKASDEETYSKDAVVADYTISPEGALTQGTESVTISFGGKTATQAITVSAAIEWVLMQIEVTTPPTKTEYAPNDSFNPAGMVVKATYSDNAGVEDDKVVDVTAKCTFSPTTIASDTKEITITFTDGEETETTTQAITVASTKTLTLNNFSFTAATDVTIATGDNNISLVAHKGSSGTNPGCYNSGIRLYQGSSSNAGGYVVIEAVNNKKILSVKVSSTNTYATTIKTKVDSGDLSDGISLAKSSSATVSGISAEGASKVYIYNYGQDKNGRLEIKELEIEYK